MQRARALRSRPRTFWVLATALAASACASGQPRRQAGGLASPPSQPREPFIPYEGNHHCYFSHQGVDEPQGACRIARTAGGALILEGGNASTHLEGAIHAIDHHSFRFDGTIAAAPGGEVVQASAPFEVVDVSIYRGALPTPRGPLWVTVAYVPTVGPKGATIP